MTIDQAEAAVAECIRDFFDDPGFVLQPGMKASDVDGWDSLAHVRLLMTLERQFKVRFSASEVGNLSTIQDLIDLLAAKTASAAI